MASGVHLNFGVGMPRTPSAAAYLRSMPMEAHHLHTHCAGFTGIFDEAREINRRSCKASANVWDGAVHRRHERQKSRS